MASPQLEDGYTRIANELLEALCVAMPGATEGQIIWAILRKTYGWKKKSDKISINQLCELTGKSRRMIIYAMQNLEAKKIIKILRKRGRGNINRVNEISLNKNHSEWVVQEKSHGYDKVLKQRKEYHKNKIKRVVQEEGGGARIGKKVVQELVKGSATVLHPQKKLTKETIQKKTALSSNSKKNSIPYREIIDYLNQQTGRHFKDTTTVTRDLIKARWDQDFRLEDFKTVIKNKTSGWLNDPHYCNFLRPQTLFGTKFEAYLNEKPPRLKDGLIGVTLCRDCKESPADGVLTDGRCNVCREAEV